MSRPASGPLIAFDLDGTLVDSAHDLTSALNAALVERGIGALDPDVLRHFVGDGARNLVLRALRAANAPTTDADVDALLVAFRDTYGRMSLDTTLPYPGVVDVVARLKLSGFVLAVATNKPGAFARVIVDALFPHHLFDVVLGPDDAGALKPDPAMLALAEARTGAVLKAYVGDSEVDVQAAAAHGVPSVAVGWGLRSDQDLAGAQTTAHTAAALEAAIRACARG